MTEQDKGSSYRSIWTYLHTVPHRMGWVEAGGVSTRYLEAGQPDRPVVLLLHGTAGSLENFCANYGPLSAEYRVIGIDMLGCGYTDKPDRPYTIGDYAGHVLNVLDALEIEEAAVIGVSLGSWVAARLAYTAPERVTALGMVAPAGIIVDQEEERKFGADVRRRRTSAAQVPTWESVTAAMGRLMLNPEDLIDDLVAIRLRIYQQPEMAAVMGHLLAFIGAGQELSHEEWRGIRQTSLVIAAVDAPNMFLDNAHALGELLPNAQLVNLTGCDHWGQFERADAFNDLALEFLRARNMEPA
jgi:2-hydroxy-6-oxonona-2,4-dienedioate hydrolase